MLPTLNQTVNISANKVEVVDGIAYATVGTNLKAIDLLTGDELQELTLPGSGTVTDLAREGNQLYAYTSGSDTFSVVDITNPTAATVQGQVNVSVASSAVGISVGNGVAYLGGSGLRTVDISDLSNPTLIGNAEQFFTARDLTLNGSGLALVAAEGQGLGIYNVSDPTDTDNFITQIDTPGFTNDIAIASGIAFVADGSSGLQVINYLSFDNQGQAPTVTISSPEADLDADVEGIQVLEGSSVPIQVDVEDDVQVRNVELLVNGEVVGNDVSFPFDLTATALNDDPEATTVDVQVRATDTGGNSTISNNLTFNLVPDTFAPNVTSTSPKADGRRKNISGISVRFDEPIDTKLLDLSGISLKNLGADEAVGGDDDTTFDLQGFQTSETGRSLFVLPPADLTPGKYQLKVDSSIITDRAGNALTEDFTLDFIKRPLVTPLTLGETITGSIFEAGEDEVYTFEGTAGQRLYYDGISGDFRIRTRLISPSGVQLFNNSTSSNRQPFNLVETGIYQLIVDGSGDTTGDFTFQLSDLDKVTDLDLDTTINGTLDSGAETDIFKFAGTKGQKLFFDNLENSLNASWSIYGPGNQRVESRSFFSDFEVTLEADGNYIAVLEGFGNEPINYNFQVVTPETVTTEFNLGEQVSSNIGEAGEEDIYTFSGTAGQRLYYDGISGDSRINTRLISPSGEQVLLTSNTSFNRQPFNLIETGTYQLIVDGNGDTKGDYSFQLLDLADAIDLTFDTTISGSLKPGQETVLYKFEGTLNQKLFLDDKGTQSRGSFVVYGPGNQQVTSQSLGFDREITLPGNGTYILAVQGSSNEETLSYSFSLITSEITTTELTLSETVSSNISKSGEEDIYTFTGTAGQRLYYDGISGQSGINTRLISPSGERVLSSRNSASNRQPFTLVETGTYQLIVDGSNGTTGDYSFQLLDTASATDLTLDSTISGSLEPGTKSDIYKFTAEAGQQLSFENKGTATGGFYRLYSGANQLITSRSLRSNFDLTLPGDGVYFLVLEGSSNDTVNYRFQIVKGTLDDTGEPVGTALTLGETVSSNIGEAEEQDTYIFTGTAGQTLYYDGISGDSQIDTRLISPSGVQLFNNNTSSNRQPFTLLESGTYQLIVDGSRNTTGDYSFQLLDTASATDLTLDTTISGSLEPGRETVLYKFTGTANQKLYLEDKGTESGSSFIIYGSGNQSVTSVSFRGNREIILPGNGTYILAVQGSSNEETPSYSFSLLTPETTTTELNLGEIVSSSISELGEEDIYTFTGTAGQSLYYDGISGESGINTRLISLSGEQVFSFFSNTSFNRQPVTLIETGTYQLIVDSNGNTTGDYSFQLLDTASATDLTLDSTISGSLEPGQETQLYKFEGTANQKLFLEDKGSQRGGSFVLYGAGNQQVTSVSLGFDREITLPGNGTYILAVQGFSNEETLSYSFSLVTSEITTTELTLGEIVSSNISKPGEEDIYTFSGTAGQTLYYDGISGDSKITRLISPSGVQLLSTNTASDRQPLTLVETGTYQLIVDGSSNTTGVYSFRLLDLATATDLIFGDTISGNLESGQQTILYKFEGTAEQQLSLEDLGSERFVGSYRLYGPGNQFITSRSVGFDFQATLPGDGIYFLAVQTNSSEEVNYSFRIS